MNIYFSKVIKAGDKQREFNFSQLSHVDDKSYKVDVPDDKGQRISFTMSLDNDNVWKTAEQHVPEWILDVAEALHEAIVQNTLSLTPVKRK
jgi:hypothetical protein